MSRINLLQRSWRERVRFPLLLVVVLGAIPCALHFARVEYLLQGARQREARTAAQRSAAEARSAAIADAFREGRSIAAEVRQSRRQGRGLHAFRCFFRQVGDALPAESRLVEMAVSRERVRLVAEAPDAKAVSAVLAALAERLPDGARLALARDASVAPVAAQVVVEWLPPSPRPDA